MPCLVIINADASIELVNSVSYPQLSIWKLTWDKTQLHYWPTWVAKNQSNTIPA